MIITDESAVEEFLWPESFGRFPRVFRTGFGRVAIPVVRGAHSVVEVVRAWGGYPDVRFSAGKRGYKCLWGAGDTLTSRVLIRDDHDSEKTP